MKSIIKVAVVFIISFICFNLGMNDFFYSYTITFTNVIMIFAPILAVTLFIINEIFEQSENNENK